MDFIPRDEYRVGVYVPYAGCRASCAARDAAKGPQPARRVSFRGRARPRPWWPRRRLHERTGHVRCGESGRLGRRGSLTSERVGRQLEEVPYVRRARGGSGSPPPSPAARWVVPGSGIDFFIHALGPGVHVALAPTACRAGSPPYAKSSPSRPLLALEPAMHSSYCLLASRDARLRGHQVCGRARERPV